MKVAMISKIKPPRMLHFGFTYSTSLELPPATRAENVPIGRTCTALMMALQWYSDWNRGINK
jgi:hypothetical protein